MFVPFQFLTSHCILFDIRIYKSVSYLGLPTDRILLINIIRSVVHCVLFVQKKGMYKLNCFKLSTLSFLIITFEVFTHSSGLFIITFIIWMRIFSVYSTFARSLHWTRIHQEDIKIGQYVSLSLDEDDVDCCASNQVVEDDEGKMPPKRPRKGSISCETNTSSINYIPALLMWCSILIILL